MRIGKLAATLWLVMLPSFGARAADIRISDLPLGAANSTGANDSFPYVDAAGGTTRRLKLSDVKNIPSMVGQYAPLNSPTFVGPVTAPSGFVGPLTGNVTGNASGSAATITGNLTGDITSVGMATTISAHSVTNADLVQMPANTFKANNQGFATTLDLTPTQATAMLDAMVGDSGSGGTKGLVPAPAAGDAAAGKYLKADGTWTAVPAAGATTALSNLASTAVNTDILPGTDVAHTLGAPSFRWDSVYAATLRDSSNQFVLDTDAHTLYSAGGVGRFSFGGALPLALGGALGIKESGGQFLALIFPTGATGYNLTFPPAPGAAGTALINDGAGNFSWATPGSPDVLTGEYFLDGTNGDDSTGTGSVEKPWLTLTHAEATLASTCSTSFRCRLHIAPGTYAEGGATTMAWHPWIDLEGAGNDPDLVSFTGIDFQPFGVSGGLRIKASGITMGSITAGSFPGGATLTLDHVHVENDVNLSHRFQHQYLSHVAVDGNYLSDGDALGGQIYADHVDVGLDFQTDLVTAGGAAMELHANVINTGGNLSFGHTENAYVFGGGQLGGLAITGTGHTVSLYTDMPLSGVPLSVGSQHFKVLSRIPDEVEDQNADFVETGVSRTIRVDTSGGPVSATIVQAQFRPQFPVKVVNTGTGQLTVQANGGESINGQATIVINGPGYVDLLADSTAANYIIIDEQLPQKMREKSSSTVISSTFATLVWDVEDYNQFGTEITGGTFQADTYGFYHACAKVNVTGTFALNNNVDLIIDTGPTPSHYAEDKPVAGGAQSSLSASVCDDFLLAAGDKVRVQVSSTATSPALSGSATQNTFTVYRISD